MAASRDDSSNLPRGEDLVKSRLPHRLPGGRGTFLGFRNTKDLPPGLNPLRSSVQPLMPDGGLSPCVIRVLGVGGGGCNAVDRMLETAGECLVAPKTGLERLARRQGERTNTISLLLTRTFFLFLDLHVTVAGVEYWAINTDAQALGRSKALGAKVLNIGATVTRGLGAGGDPTVGRMAAEESAADIAAMVRGTDLCFVTRCVCCHLRGAFREEQDPILTLA
jgi:cell division protein FtsZ